MGVTAITATERHRASCFMTGLAGLSLCRGMRASPDFPEARASQQELVWRSVSCEVVLGRTCTSVWLKRQHDLKFAAVAFLALHRNHSAMLRDDLLGAG